MLHKNVSLNDLITDVEALTGSAKLMSAQEPMPCPSNATLAAKSPHNQTRGWAPGARPSAWHVTCAFCMMLAPKTMLQPCWKEDCMMYWCCTSVFCDEGGVRTHALSNTDLNRAP